MPVVAVDYGAGGGNRTTNKYGLNVTGASGKTYLYDLNGNCTNVSMTGTNTTYEWDAENRLVAINIYATNIATMQRSEFSYDGYDRWCQIIEKTNGTVASTKKFVWCGSELYAELDAANGVSKRFFPDGEVIGGSFYYYTRDKLGSVRELTFASSVTTQYDYDPYGRRTKTAGSLDADFGYAGMYHHAASGLNLTWHRAYDSDSGRWLNRDPIAERGGLNLYDYVGNNPVNRIDKLGFAGGEEEQ